MQLINFELGGKMQIKKIVGPQPLSREKGDGVLFPPWRGWQGRGRGTQRATTTGCGGTISPKGGRTQGHVTGGAAPTPLTQNHTTREKGVAGETAPLPLPFPPHPEGAVGPGPWIVHGQKGQLVGPCSILDWSWSSASSRHMRGSSASCACGQRCPCGRKQFDKTRQHSLEIDPTRVSHLALRA